jgi:hypothetical protein
MQNSKLVKIFKSLSTEEWKYLRWFVQSNFFNTDENLVRLYDAVAKQYPEFVSKAIAKESLYKKVFVGQAYHNGKWRNLVTKMNKLLEDYLVWLELEHAPNAHQKLLTRSFGRRNLFEQFEKSTDELSSELEKQALQSAEALRERVQLNLQYYHHEQTNKLEHLNRLQTAMNDLDHYYFAEKLRLACDLKVFENMMIGAEPKRLMMEIQDLVSNGNLLNLSYLEMYNRILNQLERPAGLEAFHSTITYFSGIAGQLSAADKQLGLVHLLNYAINQANSGEGEYLSEVLDLYKLGLEQKVLIEDGKITSNTFINIVTTGSRLKHIEWTRQFIGEYEKYLATDTREETISLSMGFLYFYENEYSTVITILVNQSFRDLKENLSCKSLLLRCYFELSLKDATYTSLFYSYANSFEKYVRREKQLSLNRKSWYKNLISALVKIGKSKSENTWSLAMQEKIKHDITIKPMILKPWLIERIRNI